MAVLWTREVCQVTAAQVQKSRVKRTGLLVAAVGAYALGATVADSLGKSLEPGSTTLRWSVFVLLTVGIGTTGVAVTRPTRWVGAVLAAEGILMLAAAAFILAYPTIGGPMTHGGLLSLVSGGLWLGAALPSRVSSQS
jgi:hypothetical protein